MDSFQDEILGVINYLAALKASKPKARPIKILRLPKMTPEE